MEVQNISGPDSIPGGFSTNTEVRNESTAVEENSGSNVEYNAEPGKGNHIDTYA